MAHTHDVYDTYSSSGSDIRRVRAGTRERTHSRTQDSSNPRWDGDVNTDWDWSGKTKQAGADNRPDNVTCRFWTRTG